MAKYLTLPDGSSFQMKEGQSPAEAMRVAQQLYPEAFGSAQPKQDTSGLKAAASAGLERLKGQTALTAAKLGFKDIAEAEAYQKQQEAKAAERFTPTEKGWTEDFGLKFRETLGGSLPYMAAPVAAGAAALAAPVSAPVAAGLGLLGAGAVSTGQFTGSNLARQMDEGKSLQDASLGKAVGAAVPQALLDTAAMALLPGVGKLFGSVGSKLTNEQAKAIASQTLGKTVADYAAKTGTAMGREGVTEATQQLLERLQAGLQIADPEARKEYIDSFIGGAVLGGAVAPVGRYVERSGAQTQAQEAQQARVREQRKIADEEAKVLAAEEEARKQTPEYALDVEQRYQAAEQQKAELKAQIKKGSKEAPLSEADKAFNTDINAQLKELQPTVKELGQEFNRTAKVREQAKEQQRVDALSPEEFMLEQTMGGEGIQAADRAKKEKGALFEREAAPAAPVDTSVADYAAGQLEAARNMGAIGLDDYVGFLMQDPTMADQMVKTRTKMPDLTRQENEAVLSALKLQLKAQEKAAVAETKTELQQRQADLQAQETTTDADPLAMLRESEAEVEQQRAEGETNFDYLNDMFGQAFENQQPGVSAPESLKVTPNAPTIRRTVEKLIADRDQAEQDRAAANQAGERAAARAAAERAEEAKTALNRVSKQVGDASPYAASFVETRNAQEKALFELEDVLDKIKRGVVLGGPATEEATTTRAALQAQADDLKKQYIRGVLQEAAIHRRAQGTPAISTDEAVKAASEIDTALEELIVRMQAAPRRESLQEVITKPAQVRGTEVVSPAETEMRDLRPLEERRFGAPAEAVKVIFDQLAGVRDALSNVRGKARKIEAEPLTQQYAATEAKKVAEARGETATTLSGELRRRTEFVRNKMAKMGGMRPAARDVLNSAADVMDAGKATRELLDTVEPLVDAIVAKREVKQVDVRAVKDALSAISKQAQEGEVAGRIEGQAELFTERQDRARDDATIGVIRKNFANFEKSPPVMKARAAIEQAKKAAADAKVAQEKQAKKKVEKLVALTDAVEDQRRDLQQAITAAIETERGAFASAAKLLDAPVVAAQKALDSAKKTLDALQAKVDAAPEFADKLKYVTQVVDQRKALDAAQANLDKSIAESQATYDGATLVAAAHRDSLVRFERKALEKLEKRLDKLRSEVAAGGGDLTAIQKEAAAQRQRAAKAENDARVANEKADRDRRQLEQRLLSGLGLEGTKRVAGEVAAIKSDTDAAVDAERAEAQANRKRAEEALDKKQDVPQIARATSPVTRDVTKPGRLEESRKPKQTDVALTAAEMEKANAVAAEQKPAVEKSERQKTEEAQLQKQELLEAKERLETGLRAQLADLKIRIQALEQGVKKPDPDLMTRLYNQRDSIERQIVAARKDVEAAGKENKKAEKELAKAKKERAQKLLAEELDSDMEPMAKTPQLKQPPLFFKGVPTYSVSGDERWALNSLQKALQKETAAVSSFETRLTRAFARAEASLRGDIELFSNDVNPKYRAIAERAEVALNALRGMDVKDLSLTAAPAPKTAPTGRAPARKPTAPTVAYTREDYTSDAVAKSLGTSFVEDAPFHGMTFAEAARYGAKRTSSPQVRALFEKLAEVFDAAPAQEGAGRVYAIDRLLRGNAAGIYNSGIDVIYTRAPSARNNNANKILLHELTHAATVRALQLNSDLRSSMEDLRTRTRAWLDTPEGRTYFRNHSMGLGRTRDSIYGLTNYKEFVAELFANRDFQKMLAEIPSDKPRKSIFTRFVELMSKFFDMPAKASQSLFAEAVALTEDVLNVTKNEVYGGTAPAGGFASDISPYKEPKYASDALADAGNVAGKVIAGQRGWTETIKEEGLGMGLATRLVDRFAPLEKASKLMDSLKGTQMMYYARMFDQKMHFLSQAVSNGAIGLEKKTRADGRSEWLVESKEGASIKGVVDILKGAKDLVGSADGASQLFSLYTVAKRAERVGLKKLNFGDAVTQVDLNRAMKAIDDTPGLAKIFADARDEYNAFNKGMVQFAVDTGALRKEVAAKMLQSDDYVPFYRERDGGVEMVLGNETIAKIGNLKNQPYLKELVGGDERIIDFMTSSVQNANMLTDMALRNLSTKSAAFELRDIGMAKIGKGTASGTDVVNFKDGGEDYHAVIDTTGAGFPAELLVKGMEGIPYQTTWLTKGLGIPAKILRKAVTLNPAYAARQLFRDSLAAPLLSGANFTPIIGALKEINGTANKTLERRGITGGQVFTGTQEDMADTLRRLTAGESGWLQGLSKLEALSMEADALTRRAQYNSYIQQGLSEMEATYTALESMNFSKRGASPAMHFLSTVIPFFNAQIQGLNVLFKAFTGDMPFNEKLKVREKLLQRGAVLAGATMIYAALMQDDESYKNATPEQKYGNWFIHVPGLDEAVKLPIPFEIGYIFKALPEALVNMMAKEEGGEEALKAFKQIALQTIPGGSSYGLPQAIKPLIEVGLGKSFYTGRDLESAYEQSMVPGKRTRENTTDFARTVGDMFNVSPIKIDALIQGYTSSTGLAFVNALSFAIPTPPSPDKAALRASEIPLVGSLFQPKDAGGIINAAYERMNEAKQVKSTFDGLMEKGRTEEARAFLQENLEKFANAGLATNFTSTMQKLSQAERAVRASDASPETKRAQLDQIKQAKIKIAEAVREAGRTTPQ